MTDADNRTTSTFYDALDRVSTVSDPVLRRTHFIYDNVGQVLMELHAWQGTGFACAVPYTTQNCFRRYTYGDDGEQLTAEDARNNITTYGYDGFNRLNLTTYSDGTTEPLTSIDADGNILTRVNRGTQTHTYTYDALDQIRTQLVPATGVAYAWSYRLDGTIDKVCDTNNCATSSHIIDYGYDTAGRQTSVANAIPGLSGWHTFSYALDDNGNRTGLTFPDGYVVTYGYDGYCQRRSG